MKKNRRRNYQSKNIARNFKKTKKYWNQIIKITKSITGKGKRKEKRIKRRKKQKKQ
jgi:hypothetical protein